MITHIRDWNQHAIAYADTALSIGLKQNDIPTLLHVCWVYAKAGLEDKARKVFEDFIELSKDQIIDPLSFGFLYAGLGDKEEAFKWILKGVEERSGSAIYLKGYEDWIFKDLSSDPRYDDLLRKIGFRVE